MELLTALALSTLVVVAVGSLLIHQASALTRSTRLVERLDVARTVHLVLRSELQSGRFASDWRVLGDTVFLRAFRGTALPCRDDESGSGGSSGPVVVRIRGVRRPEPRKDSVLILDSGGTWHAASLADVLEGWGAGGEEGDETAGDPCMGASASGEGWIQRWNRSWGPSGAVIVLGRTFERGSYHLADGALRYRIGRGGRQPLTPELLDTEASSLFLEESVPRLVLRLRFQEERRSEHESSEVGEDSSFHDTVEARIWFPEP